MKVSREQQTYELNEIWRGAGGVLRLFRTTRCSREFFGSLEARYGNEVPYGRNR